MENETTTTVADESAGTQTVQGIAVDDQGQAIPQAEDTSEQTAAVEPTTETEGNEEAASEPSEPVDDTSEWLKKKGIDPTDPEAITKLAKAGREAEQLMHKATVQRSELEKVAKITDEQVKADATPEQRENVRLRNLELRTDIQDWKLRNQDKMTYEPQMVKVLSDPNKRLLVQEGYLSLDDVYSMARGSTTDEASIKSQGAREALQKVAQNQQAQSPRGNATNTATMSSVRITPQNVDQMVGSHDQKWYMAHRDEINKAMAG